MIIDNDETAFETAARWKEVDADKSKSGKRLLAAYDKCRGAGS